jgi:hypothetical protein
VANLTVSQTVAIVGGVVEGVVIAELPEVGAWPGGGWTGQGGGDWETGRLWLVW